MIRWVHPLPMALTDTPSTWQTAALADGGPGMPRMDGGGFELQPVLSALASAPVRFNDVEGAPHLGSVCPQVRRFHVDHGAPSTARRNCWAEAR